MSLRRQLPVYSPLPAGALLSGLRAITAGGADARRQVSAWIESTFGSAPPLLTDSGTSALAIAMRAAVRHAEGKAVLLPAYGCYDLVTAALTAEVPVRWYDLDPQTLGPDWRSLELGLAGGVAAIVAVHQYGIPVDLRRIRQTAPGGTVIIEDAAQGIGGSLEGKPLGGHGDLGVLSFGRGKGLTGGGGGALLPVSTLGCEILASEGALPGGDGNLRAGVGVVAQWSLGRPALYGLPASLPFLRLGDTVFRQPSPVRAMNAMAAGILTSTITRMDGESALRTRNAKRLAAKIPPDALPMAGEGEPGYLRLPVLAPEHARKLAETERARAMGIMPGYPRVLTTLPGPTASAQPMRGAQRLVERLFTLPLHSRLSERDLEDLGRWIGEIFS